MYRCLSPDPAARPTATQLVELLQAAPGTPASSTEPSAVGAPLAPAAAAPSWGSASGGSGPVDSGSPHKAQQHAQHAQHWGGADAPRAPPLAAVDEDGGLAELPSGCPASLGWAVRSTGTVMSVKSQKELEEELEEELVEELVAESAPNSGMYLAGPPSGGASGPPSGGGAGGALQRRLVLPSTGLAASSPFSAPSPFGQGVACGGAAPQSPFFAGPAH